MNLFHAEPLAQFDMVYLPAYCWQKARYRQEREVMRAIRIHTVTPYDWTEILSASRHEGHNMVNRLLTDFQAGTNRFDAPGEILFVHLETGAVVAVCGLNREEETGFGKAGRIRRLYVSPGYRGRGLARHLIEAILSSAIDHHEMLTVNVGKLAARGFYEHLGFMPVTHPRITHIKELDVRKTSHTME